MKTSHIPVLCMLVAGITAFILDIVQGMDFSTLLRDFLISLVCFFIIGSIIKVLLDRAFNPKEPDPEETEKEDFPVDGENPEGETEESAEDEESVNDEETATQEDTEGF